MKWIFVVVYVLWFVTEVALNKLLRSKNTDKQHADKGSLSLIWMVIVATLFIAVFISNLIYLPISLNRVFPYIGLAIIVAGILLRLIAVVSLGRFFTVDVTIRQNHKLKKNGMYRYLRHPSYFASLLSFIGMGISLNNWISLVLIVLSISTVFMVRINIEEKVLIEQFGPEYLAYKKATWRLFPFIY